MNPRLPNPERQRQIPSQFSWLDQRLARHHYFERASHQAWTLYLFLLTVADAQGLSYYSERSLSQRLHLDGPALQQARQALIKLELIAYQHPFYQVLAVVEPRHRRSSATEARHQLQQLRQQLRGGLR